MIRNIELPNENLKKTELCMNESNFHHIYRFLPGSEKSCPIGISMCHQCWIRERPKLEKRPFLQSLRESEVLNVHCA